jgi:hypothetical protein
MPFLLLVEATIGGLKKATDKLNEHQENLKDMPSTLAFGIPNPVYWLLYGLIEAAKAIVYVVQKILEALQYLVKKLEAIMTTINRAAKAKKLIRDWRAADFFLVSLLSPLSFPSVSQGDVHIFFHASISSPADTIIITTATGFISCY